LGGAATPDFEAQRARLRSDLDAARGEFHAMVASISEREWTEPSQNPGWTNGQVVFHIRLGFILVVPLARLLVFFDRLPALCSRILPGSSTYRLRSSIESTRWGLERGRDCSGGLGSSASLIRSTAPFSPGSIKRALAIGQRQCTIRPALPNTHGLGGLVAVSGWPSTTSSRSVAGHLKRTLNLTSAGWQSGVALAG
jgi:hypothetical protein